LEKFDPHLPALILVFTISLILLLIVGFNYNEANVIMNLSGSQGVVERLLPMLVWHIGSKIGINIGINIDIQY
jgi:hypothetical protein